MRKNIYFLCILSDGIKSNGQSIKGLTIKKISQNILWCRYLPKIMIKDGQDAHPKTWDNLFLGVFF